MDVQKIFCKRCHWHLQNVELYLNSATSVEKCESRHIYLEGAQAKIHSSTVH